MTAYREWRAPIAYIADPAARAQTYYNLIQSARESLILQMYLLAEGDELATLQPIPGAFPWARTLSDWLIARKRDCPALDIVVILDTQTPADPTATRRGTGPLTRHRLEAAGIPVLNAHLFDTRFDRRRRWPRSARFHQKAWQETPRQRWVRAQRHWQTWHNVEDHRKNLVIDGGAWGFVTSQNATDMSARWHENALLVGAPAAGDLWVEATKALRKALTLPQGLTAPTRARLETLAGQPPTRQETAPPAAALVPALSALGGAPAQAVPAHGRVMVLASTEIRPAIVRDLRALPPDGEFLAASAYLSDAALIESLATHPSGVRARVLIDDCAGLPLPRILRWAVTTFVNLRGVAQARKARGGRFEMRIHRSGGRGLMHLKTCAFLGDTRHLIGGQANFTPNSFSGAWIETDLRVVDGDAVDAFVAQFEPLWAGAEPVLPYGRRLGGLRGRLVAAYERSRDACLLGLLAVFERIGIRP